MRQICVRTSRRWHITGRSAEAPDATIRYSDLAASQALAAGAFEEAERLLGTASRLHAQAASPIATGGPHSLVSADR